LYYQIKEKMKDPRIEKFERMVTCVGIGFKGELFFDNDRFIHDASFGDLHKDSDLSFLKEKMNNFLTLVNSDLSLAEKDIANELWDLI
jgi:hypothetical protein